MPRPECICDHHLFVELLGPESVVLDLGAYLGVFSSDITERTDARVVAVEANPRQFDKIDDAERVKRLNCAVSDCEGLVRLYLGSNPLGTSVCPDHPYASEETIEVRATTLPRLISDHCGGRLDLLKVNIEGAEIPMLQACDDRTLQGIGQITIQFHDFIPELNQASDVRCAKQRLRDLGFGELLFKAPNKDVLFVNLRAGALSRGRFLAEKALVRCKQYKRAVEKKLERAF